MTMTVVWRLTESRFVLRDMSIRTDCLVLSVHQHPQTDSIFRVMEVLCDSFFEHGVGLLLQDTETWQFGWWPILLVKTCEIKTFMMSKRFICNDLKYS